jgi:hypothetical protein
LLSFTTANFHVGQALGLQAGSQPASLVGNELKIAGYLAQE